jgi:hypothetical protein
MSLERNGKSENPKRRHGPRRWPFFLIGFFVGFSAPIYYEAYRPRDHRITVFEFLDRPAHAPSATRSIDGQDIPLRFAGERLVEWTVHATRRSEIAVRAVFAGPNSDPVVVSEIVRLDPKDLECRIRIRATAERIAISQCLRRNPNVS